MTEEERATALRTQEQKQHLLIRQKLIDSKEGTLIKVVDEFERAFDILSKYHHTVTIFGSARLPQSDPLCKQAFAVAWALAKHDYAVVTGGGGGVMQAANHGAMKAGGASIGFNIHLPQEQKLNKYTTDHYRFEHFFGRKVAMTLDASGYIYCGGGFGTFDELFEIITLVQTGTIPAAPIILMGVDFWKPFDTVIKRVLVDTYRTVDADDRDLYTITDDITEIVEIINTHSQKQAVDEMNRRAQREIQRWEKQREEE